MDGVGDTCKTDSPLWECNLCDGYVLQEPIPDKPHFVRQAAGISWVICGGESGPGARPFNLAWAESLLAQCRAADVLFFMKQVGSKPTCDAKGYACCVFPMKDRKGGDPTEWPDHLRIRDFPQPAVRETVSA
jgi:hypothetical protein